MAGVSGSQLARWLRTIAVCIERGDKDLHGLLDYFSTCEILNSYNTLINCERTIDALSRLSHGRPFGLGNRRKRGPREDR